MRLPLAFFLCYLSFFSTSSPAQNFTITGANVDTSKIRITGFKQTPKPSPTAPLPSSNERVQPFYDKRPAPKTPGSTTSYGTYAVTPPPQTSGGNVTIQGGVPVLNGYAPKAQPGVLITNDMGVDKPKTPKNINISSVKGLAEACQHVIFAQTGRAYDERSYGLCFGYMRGVKNSYDIQRAVSKRGKICFPRNVTWLQIIKVYLKWVDSHPENLHNIAWEGTVQSMRSAFPCKKKK